MSMELIITIRKTVTDQQAGEDLYDVVKEKLKDKPGIRLTGHLSNHFANDEIEE